MTAPARCNCEHAVHEDLGCKNTRGVHQVIMVGGVCDECAGSHLSDLHEDENGGCAGCPALSRADVIAAGIEDIPQMTTDDVQQFVRDAAVDLATCVVSRHLPRSLQSVLGQPVTDMPGRARLLLIAERAVTAGLLELDHRSGRQRTPAERATDALAGTLDEFETVRVVAALEAAGSLR